MKGFILTVFALVAFAGNSVLCRMALGEQQIDAASFTAIRLLSGAITLAALLVLFSKPSKTLSTGSWKGCLTLFVYAVTFSYAYMSLDTGTGALVLFGVVQLTIIGVSLFRGQRLTVLEYLGVAVSFVGLCYLLLPDLSVPTVTGFILMALSGLAWGAYTILGKTSSNPLADTAYNFIRSLPLVFVLVAFTLSGASFTSQGIALAIISGAITSGLGYAIWYAALAGLTSVQAAVVQLLVPILAALGGVIFYTEALSFHFVLSSIIVLGGILIVQFAKFRKMNHSS